MEMVEPVKSTRFGDSWTTKCDDWDAPDSGTARSAQPVSPLGIPAGHVGVTGASMPVSVSMPESIPVSTVASTVASESIPVSTVASASIGASTVASAAVPASDELLEELLLVVVVLDVLVL